MKAKFVLAFLPAVCLSWPATAIHAQRTLVAPASAAPASTQSRPAADSPLATGRIAGILKDPSGAAVQGATIDVVNLASGLRKSQATNLEGRFAFDALPVGLYRVTVTASGFDTAVLHDLAVTGGAETAADVALRIAPAKSVVEVIASAIETVAGTRHAVDENDRARSRNAAELVGNTPGVSLRETASSPRSRCSMGWETSAPSWSSTA